MKSYSICVENPCHAGIELLIEALNIEIDSMTPPETNTKMSVQDMDNDYTTVLVARVNGVAVACGAIVFQTPEIAEIKRMYTKPEFRGMGISRAILIKLENLARTGHAEKLVLETGYNYTAAIALYTKLGRVECQPILDYKPNPYSLFFEKVL